MTDLISRIGDAIRNPEKVLNRILWYVRQLSVKKVKKDGKIFYLYHGEFYPSHLSNGNAASFIMDKARQYCHGSGLDIGADIWAFPGAVPVQEEKDQNAYKLDKFPDGSMDYIFSSHCLEHLEKWQDAISLWITKLKIGGILFLYLPHESMLLWKPGAPWVGSFHKWSPTYEVVNCFLEKQGMEIIDYNQDKDDYWSFHIVARKKTGLQ